MNVRIEALARAGSIAILLSLACLLPACSSGQKEGGFGMAFQTPEEAVRALAEAIRVEDPAKLESILGPEGQEIIGSGDDVADRAGRKRFLEIFDEKNRIEPVKDAEDEVILYIGALDWPFPIPIVKLDDDMWYFDTEAGKEELLNRRIGKNELNAIQVCLAIADAEREYAAKDRDGDGILEYAQKFRSTPGTKDGLYWPAEKGEEASPLGPFAAQAFQEGYRKAKDSNEPQPYHGYLYKILKAQGEHAPGGAYEYLAGENMIGGFAVLAYPASYGVSGIMSFIVSHDGVVYEKDLGEETEKEAQAMTIFDPDSSWKKASP